MKQLEQTEDVFNARRQRRHAVSRDDDVMMHDAVRSMDRRYYVNAR